MSLCILEIRASHAVVVALEAKLLFFSFSNVKEFNLFKMVFIQGVLLNL